MIEVILTAWSCIDETLYHIAAGILQHIQLLSTFNAFRNDLHIQLLGHADHTFQNRFIALHMTALVKEYSVKLYYIYRKVL